MQVVHLVSICNTEEQMFVHSNHTTTVHWFSNDFWRRRQLLAHKAGYLDEAQDTQKWEDVCGLLMQERNKWYHLPSFWSWEADLERWGWSCAIFLPPNHQELWPAVPKVEKEILFNEGTVIAEFDPRNGNKDNWKEKALPPCLIIRLF